MIGWNNHLRITLLLTGIMLVDVSHGFAQTMPRVNLESLRQTKPDFMVRVDVDRISRQYQEGDQLTLSIVSEIDAYLYVFYEQADGKLFQVFPNNRQSNNKVQGKNEVLIPAADDLFRWRIGAPFGVETVKVIATEKPLRSLADPKLKGQRFNPVDEKLLKGVALELGPEESVINEIPDPPEPIDDEPTRWAEADVQILTAPMSEEFRNSKGRRYGVFFGVSEHQYAAFSEAGTGRSPNLTTPAPDALVMDRMMQDVGRLNETQVFTNEKATRKNLEESICKWLPKMSKPGDTVVIYFSGHGGQWQDDYGDEEDGLDEYLVPYDYLGTAAVEGMLKLEEAGQLPAEYQPLLNNLKEHFRTLGLERGSDILIRETGVTDDLFSHWLQKLDGREIIVILDICHAGGFATQEKSLDKNGKPLKFDFLDRELARLKDIGQSNTALLTASSTAENSLVRQENDLSVMTYYLAEGLFGYKGPMSLTAAHEVCIKGMEQYFRDHPNATPHHPQLYNQMSRPVFLKP